MYLIELIKSLKFRSSILILIYVAEFHKKTFKKADVINAMNLTNAQFKAGINELKKIIPIKYNNRRKNYILRSQRIVDEIILDYFEWCDFLKNDDKQTLKIYLFTN